MTRADVAATLAAFRAQTTTNRLALFFHGGLVDTASGQQGAANEYEEYNGIVFPLFLSSLSGNREFGKYWRTTFPLFSRRRYSDLKGFITIRDLAE
jgi:hypothetical protein